MHPGGGSDAGGGGDGPNGTIGVSGVVSGDVGASSARGHPAQFRSRKTCRPPTDQPATEIEIESVTGSGSVTGSVFEIAGENTHDGGRRRTAVGSGGAALKWAGSNAGPSCLKWHGSAAGLGNHRALRTDHC